MHKVAQLLCQLVRHVLRRQLEVDLHNGVEGAPQVHELGLLVESRVFQVDALVREVSGLGGEDVDLLHRVHGVVHADAVADIVGVHHQDQHHAFEDIPQQAAKDEGETDEGGRGADAQGAQGFHRHHHGQDDANRDQGLQSLQQVAEDEPDRCIVLHRGCKHVEALEETAHSRHELLLGDALSRGALSARRRGHVPGEHLPRPVRVIERHGALHSVACKTVPIELFIGGEDGVGLLEVGNVGRTRGNRDLRIAE
mmetsp:Transcript_71695/g.184918  ORF Transcript_71695/g.184918 Transcript_71695/m.184918 type:complete len:254 (-) Transcript_71695:916-1677(-)